MHAHALEEPQEASLLFWSSGSEHHKQILFTTNSTMAEGQIKNKGQKVAVGCRHTVFERDHHCFCVSCREKNKGDEVCVTSKQDDCFVCLQFTAEQRKNLKAKKAYEKKKSSKESISKEVEDSLLGTDNIQPSSVTATKRKICI